MKHRKRFISRIPSAAGKLYACLKSELPLNHTKYFSLKEFRGFFYDSFPPSMPAMPLNIYKVFLNELVYPVIYQIYQTTDLTIEDGIKETIYNKGTQARVVGFTLIFDLKATK